MFRPYEASSTSVEVDGRTILAVVNGMMIARVGAELLAREGLRDIQPDGWYDQQAWLNVFRTIADRLGEDTLYSIGYRIPYSAEFPADRMHDVATALESIDIAYRNAHRGGEIGCYEYSRYELDSHQIRCDNPYPCAFDMGIVWSLVERFRGSQKYEVYHLNAKDRACRNKGGHECVYRVVALPR